MSRFLGILGVVFLLFAGWVFYSYSTASLPEKEIFPIWLPANAELYSSQVVKPGTFAITLSFEEFKATTTDQWVAVTYKEKISLKDDAALAPEYRVPAIEYWRPYQGGVFHYAKFFLPLPQQPYNPLIGWQAIFDKEQNSFHYIPSKDTIVFLGGMLIPGIVGILFLAIGTGRLKIEPIGR